MISKRQQLEQWTTVVADTGDLERIAMEGLVGRGVFDDGPSRLRFER